MEIQINLSELQKIKLFIATPMYGGMACGHYTNSMVNLAGVLLRHGVQFQTHFLFNESLITRARNYCVDEFMRSDCTHLLFLDADIGFDPRDVIAMLALLTIKDNEYDVLCAPYPKKVISWEKIKMAVDRGFADENANNLQNFVGDFVFNPANGQNEMRLDEPAQVMEAGTGFMIIRRATFEKYEGAYPELKYLPDHVRSEHFDGTREIYAYFDTVIDPKSRRYLSEDYMFCQKATDIGLKIWLCPWIKTQHMGSYLFGGSLVDLATAGVYATADRDHLESTKKRKKKLKMEK